MNRRVVMIMLLWCLVGMVSCGDEDPITTVKNGMLPFNTSTTVGMAFDNYQYFKSTEWIYFQTPNGQKIVQCTGHLDVKKLAQNDPKKDNRVNFEGHTVSLDLVVQFMLTGNGDFNVHYLGTVGNIDGESKTFDEDVSTDKKLSQNLSPIYNDTFPN